MHCLVPVMGNNSSSPYGPWMNCCGSNVAQQQINMELKQETEQYRKTNDQKKKRKPPITLKQSVSSDESEQEYFKSISNDYKVSNVTNNELTITTNNQYVSEKKHKPSSTASSSLYNTGTLTINSKTASLASTGSFNGKLISLAKKKSLITPNQIQTIRDNIDKMNAIKNIEHRMSVGEYVDYAKLLLLSLKEEEERESSKILNGWLDEYKLDYLQIRNEFDNDWITTRIIKRKKNQICIWNTTKNQYEWVNKRSSKLRPHKDHYSEKHKHKNRTSSNLYQIELNSKSPPLLPCHPSKILYYFDTESKKDYILACTPWKIFSTGYSAGVYRYDLNTQKCELYKNYPMNPRQFEPIFDYDNDQLHIYCQKTLTTPWPIWSILDIETKKWNVTSQTDAILFNLLDIQCSASIIVNGQLYLFGEGRFGRFVSSNLFLIVSVKCDKAILSQLIILSFMCVQCGTVAFELELCAIAA